MVYPKFIHPNPKTFNIYHRQYFSLPYGLICNITENPASADGLQKLQKTCKYFFAKNKIIVVNYKIEHCNNQNLYCEMETKNGIKNYDFCFNNRIKYWENNYFSIWDVPKSFINLNNIYRWTLKELTIIGQTLKLSEFDLLTNGGKIQDLWFYSSNVYGDDDHGALVSCDRILAKVPNIQKLNYGCSNELCTTETLKKLITVKFNFKLNYFRFHFFIISADADISLLCKFMKRHSTKKTYFRFEFRMNDGKKWKKKLMDIINRQKFLAWIKEKKISGEISTNNGKTVRFG